VGSVNKRSLSCAAVGLLALVLVNWPLVVAIVRLSLHDDRYLQILLAPFLCGFLIHWYRAEIFAAPEYAPRVGVPLVLVAVILCITATYWQPRTTTTLLLAQSAFVLLSASAFFLVCGARSFRAALYPLCCLLLMIPLPSGLMDQVSAGFQHGSANVSYAIFRLTGTPVLRQGMQFSLPGLDIEIASECSGIRSSLMFLMVGILTASLFLRSSWSQAVLIVATIPIAICKNAVRIVSLSLLSIHVNRVFLEGPIHHKYGGVLSLPVDLALFIPLLLALRKSEDRSSSAQPSQK